MRALLPLLTTVAVLAAAAPADAKRTGRAVRPSELRAEPLPTPSGDVWIYSQSTGEELRVKLYKPDGSLDDDALASLDRAFQCKRTGRVREVNRELYVLLAIIADRFDGRRIELTSGFRHQKNRRSRHFHASAMDIRVDGVSTRELYEVATSLDTGHLGIGRYPHKRLVHIDVRAPGEPSYRWVDTATRRRARRRPRDAGSS